MCANLCTRDHPCHAMPCHPIELRPSRSHARTSRPCHAIRSGRVYHMRWRQMHSTVCASHSIWCTVHAKQAALGPLLVHVGGERSDRRCHAHRDDPHRHHLCVASSHRDCNAKHTLHATWMHVRACMRACVHAHVCFRVRLCVRVHALACAFARVPQHTAPILASRLSRLSRPSWPRCNSADAAGCTRGSPQRNTECVRRSHAVAIAADSTTTVKPTRQQGKETRIRAAYGSTSVDRPQVSCTGR